MRILCKSQQSCLPIPALSRDPIKAARKKISTILPSGEIIPPNRGSRVMESLNEVVSEINHPILYFNFAVGHVGEFGIVGDNDESVSEVSPEFKK